MSGICNMLHLSFVFVNAILHEHMRRYSAILLQCCDGSTALPCVFKHHSSPPVVNVVTCIVVFRCTWSADRGTGEDLQSVIIIMILKWQQKYTYMTAAAAAADTWQQQQQQQWDAWRSTNTDDDYQAGQKVWWSWPSMCDVCYIFQI